MAKINKLLDRAKEHFESGEEAITTILGVYGTEVFKGKGQRHGILVATNQRLVFYAKKGTGFEFEVFPYETISSIDAGKSFMGHHVSFFSSGNKVSMEWIQTEDIQEFVEAVKSRVGEAKSTAPTSAQTTDDQLAQPDEEPPKLRDAGGVSESDEEAKPTTKTKKKWVLTGVVVALVCVGWLSEEPADPAQAHSYKVIDAEDFSSAKRKRIRWHIVAPQAESVADRAATVVQAAKDLMAEAVETDRVAVWLHIDERLMAAGKLLASASYTPDGKGASGEDDGGEVWEVESSDTQLSEQDLRVLMGWEQHKERFRDELELLDEERLVQYLSEELNIGETEVKFPSWIPRDFPYDGEDYEVVGTKASDSIANPASFALSRCRQSAACWGDEHMVMAASACAPVVERLAQYAHEWTDGFLGFKFSRYRWSDKDRGVVTYIGDEIRFQNGFGAWQNYVYECDYNPSTESVEDVRAAPGRM